METYLVLPLALLLDRWLGEPTRLHPLVGFGNIANALEKHLNNQVFFRGVIAWVITVIPITLMVYSLDQWLGGLWLSVIAGWLAIGWKSLRQHGLAVAHAFKNNDLREARLRTAYLVSRDTAALDETALSKATIESLLENGSDAIVAPLFWLALFGAPGVIFYRLCNTLDAMWGYRHSRFEQFGKFTAIMDDILNYIPARITALLYLIFGHSQSAWQAWQTQGILWYSPNAGIVMASGAGALGLSLGGDAVYQGEVKHRLCLGAGHQPLAKDIDHAIRLVDKSIVALLSLPLILLGLHSAYDYFT